MKINKQLKNKSGIYSIINLVNGKRYIGKSININNRIANHICGLTSKSKDCNRYLINSWHKYGRNNFIYEILEEIDIHSENFQNNIKDRELYWMNYYNTTDLNYGYNLRRDSSSQSFVHEKTRELLKKRMKGKLNPNFNNRWTEEQKKIMSEKILKTFKKGNRKKVPYEIQVKGVYTRKQKYENNPEIKKQDILKQSQKITKYYIDQYTKDKQMLIKRWNTVYELLEQNPDYKRHNIYAVCSGEKPSMYGYWWNKVLIDDKVQTE